MPTNKRCLPSTRCDASAMQYGAQSMLLSILTIRRRSSVMHVTCGRWSVTMCDCFIHSQPLQQFYLLLIQCAPAMKHWLLLTRKHQNDAKQNNTRHALATHTMTQAITVAASGWNALPMDHRPRFRHGGDCIAKPSKSVALLPIMTKRSSFVHKA